MTAATPHAELAALAVESWARTAPTDGPRLAAAGWSLSPAGAGGNGVVFRAERGGQVHAVKLSPLDERRRGAREYAALRLLDRVGVPIAPLPLALVEAPGGHPVSVLVTSWVDGVPPVADAGTAVAAADLLARLHAGTRGAVGDLPPAVDGTSPRGVLDRARRHADAVGDPGLRDLLRTATRRSRGWPEATGAPESLLHCDANLANLLATPAGVAMVDWENSGRGDPCFDAADLCLHPGAFGDRRDLWPTIVDRHAAALGDPGARERTWRFATALAVFWVAISLSEAARPRPRLAGTRRPPRVDLVAQADRYHALAEALLDHP